MSRTVRPSSAPAEPGETTAHHVPDAHEVEAHAAAADIYRDGAEMVLHVLGGLPGLVRTLDRECADVWQDIERSGRHDPAQIGMLTALAECRKAIAALLPDGDEPDVDPASTADRA